MSGTGANKQPILEIDLNVALCGLDITFEQFVDLCILCGCDYCSNIKGIGPKTALKLIRQYKTLEGVVQFVKRDMKKKYQLPKDWTSYRLKPEPIEHSSSLADEVLESQEESQAVEEPRNEVSVVADRELTPLSSTIPSTLAARSEPENLVDSDDEICVPDMEDMEDGLDEEEDIDLNLDDLPNAESSISENETTENSLAENENEEGELIQPMYVRARELFYNHEVISAADIELKWLPPQEEELRKFLVERMGFNPERVENGIKKLVEAQGKKAQQRLDRYYIS